MTTAVGEKIRKLRKERGYTLDQLAELTGSSKSYIWEIENKAPPRPSADKLSKIANALDVTIEYLMDDSGAIDQEDAADAAFFRKYKQLSEGDRARLRKMIDLWDDD
ncbi:MAG: helix-turn-helix domain-containing protein [Gammaproteobacteria bacterium]|nr:helix-turn-helix domain-containing protein [Gammaproteobacteria bacterium]